jgi:hypothetical protein
VNGPPAATSIAPNCDPPMTAASTVSAKSLRRVLGVFSVRSESQSFLRQSGILRRVMPGNSGFLVHESASDRNGRTLTNGSTRFQSWIVHGDDLRPDSVHGCGRLAGRWGLRLNGYGQSMVPPQHDASTRLEGCFGKGI